MAHSFQLKTERLLITPVVKSDSSFLRKLMNTQGWKRFIGDRSIHSEKRASSYVEDVINDPNVSYWVVSLKEKKDKVGIITIIKRNTATYPDIGFALLPEHKGNGYAYEAASAVLEKLASQFPTILGITLSDNPNSINLLKKLGFTLKEKNEEGTSLTFEISSRVQKKP